MNRREFLVRVGGSLVAVPVLLQVVSCGTSAAPAHVHEFSAAAVGSGHTHNATLTCSQLTGAVAVNLTSTAGGSPTHSHTVPLTNGDLVTIASGGLVTITTNDNAHSHDWAFQKPANVC